MIYEFKSKRKLVQEKLIKFAKDPQTININHLTFILELSDEDLLKASKTEGLSLTELFDALTAHQALIAGMYQDSLLMIEAAELSRLEQQAKGHRRMVRVTESWLSFLRSKADDEDDFLGFISEKKKALLQLILKDRELRGELLYFSVEVGPEDCCAICLNSLTEVADCVALECRHVFHAPCVTTWIAEHPSCPLCKKGLDAWIVASITNF